jgi:hypothetical protein
MAALTKARRLRRESWKRKSFTLASGKKAFKGGMAVYDQSVGKCIPAETGASQTDLFLLGLFAEDVDATAADKAVVVELKREINVVWMKNDGTNPVVAADIGKSVYGVDDQTVSNSSATSTRSIVGTAWAIDSTLGVAVELS